MGYEGIRMYTCRQRRGAYLEATGGHPDPDVSIYIYMYICVYIYIYDLIYCI